MADDIDASIFQPHVGTSFRVTGEGDGAVELELVDVRLDTRHEGAPREQPFTLRFEGAAGLGQGTFAFAHDALGTLEVFVVPTAPGEYEAVFN